MQLKNIMKRSFAKVKEDLSYFKDWTARWVAFLEADNRELRTRLNNLEKRLFILETYLNSVASQSKSEEISIQTPYYR